MENPEVYYVNNSPAPKKGFAIAGLILGIASVVLGYETWYLGVAAGVVGLILSIRAKKSYEAAGMKSGMATAGFILSIVGLAVSCFGLVMCITCGGCLMSAGTGALTEGLVDGDLPSDIAKDIADSLGSAASDIAEGLGGAASDIAEGLGEAASELAQAATEISGVM